jgi:hypothetical protein
MKLLLVASIAALVALSGCQDAPASQRFAVNLADSGAARPAADEPGEPEEPIEPEVPEVPDDPPDEPDTPDTPDEPGGGPNTDDPGVVAGALIAVAAGH